MVVVLLVALDGVEVRSVEESDRATPEPGGLVAIFVRPDHEPITVRRSPLSMSIATMRWLFVSAT